MKKLRFTCVLLSLIMLSSLLFNSYAQNISQDTIYKFCTDCTITEGTYLETKDGLAVFKVDSKWGCDFKFKEEQVVGYDLTPNKKYILYVDEGSLRDYKNIELEYIQNSGEITLDDKISFLKHFGVVNGYSNGELKLSNNVTRAEFATMITRVNILRGKSNTVPMFSDISGHWAESYIKEAFAFEVVNGVSPVKFDPDGFIKYQDMVVMAVRSVAPHFTGEYPNDHLDLAKSEGLITNTDNTGYATRKDICEIIYNCYNTQCTEPFEITEKETETETPAGAGAKPVIYLYPEKKQEVSVSLELDGEFTFTYPQYKAGGWNVTASPDGTITCDGREYSYLFWEGTMPNFKPDFSKGFIVAREDTVPFLQKILSEMGLIPREYNEFIVYWAPILSENAYNKITFDTEQYEKAAKLKITPTPDSMLRVYMVYEPAMGSEVLPPQTFDIFERKGFTVVEWGGRRID